MCFVTTPKSTDYISIWMHKPFIFFLHKKFLELKGKHLLYGFINLSEKTSRLISCLRPLDPSMGMRDTN